MSTDRASLALLSRIAQTVLREFKRADLYVAPPAPGMMLTKAHFELMERSESDRIDDPQSVTALLELSMLVDCIQSDPKALTTPADQPEYLSEVFPRLLERVAFLPTPQDAEAQRDYQRALATLYEDRPNKTPAYDEFCELRAEVEKKDVALLEMQRNLAAAAEEERAVLESELITAKELQREKGEVLSALDRAYGFYDAEGVEQAAERSASQIPESIALAAETMALATVSTGFASHAQCTFFPSRLSEDNWIPLRLSSKDIAEQTLRGSASVSRDTLDDAEIDSIEVETQTVVCQRPWLWPALFEHTGWKLDPASSPRVSNGGQQHDPGLIPGYIYALVFGRNLRIRGRSTAALQMMSSKAAPVSGGSDSALTFLMRASRPVPLPAAKPALPQLAGRVVETQAVTSRATNPKTTTAARPRVGSADTEPPLAASAKASPSTPPVAFKPVSGSTPLPGGKIDPPSRVSFRYSLSGRTLDAQGQGSYQARVTLQVGTAVRTTLTGRDGTFTFVGLPAGKHPLTVAKAGHQTLKTTATLPATSVLLLKLRPEATGKLEVVLTERVDGATLPFTGPVKIRLGTVAGPQLESMSGSSRATFLVPPGKVEISLICAGAQKVSPSSATLTLSSSVRTASFVIQPAPLLENAEVQLLGVICRRVPLCPRQ